MSEEHTCPACDGKGGYYQDQGPCSPSLWVRCERCGGTGKVTSEGEATEGG